MNLDRYRANRRGLRDVLGSEPVRTELVRRAEAVAAAADAEYTARPPHSGVVNVYVDSQSGTPGHPRARAAVIAQHPAVLPIEAERRTLGAALDAART